MDDASVLITRPVGQGRALTRQVRAMGGRPMLLPGVALRPASDVPCDALRAAWDDDLIVFISPAAVRYAARWMPLRGRARVACVGAGTARALARHGVTDVIVPSAEQNSSGLLTHPALKQVRGRKVAVVGAPGGRGVLQHTLRERGAAVRDVHVYQRVPARLDRRHREMVRRRGGRRYILLSSVETLRCLHTTLAGADWQNVCTAHAVVSSERVAAAARAAGFKRVSVADSALAESLLARVAELDASARASL